MSDYYDCFRCGSEWEPEEGCIKGCSSAPEANWEKVGRHTPTFRVTFPASGHVRWVELSPSVTQDDLESPGVYLLGTSDLFSRRWIYIGKSDNAMVERINSHLLYSSNKEVRRAAYSGGKGRRWEVDALSFNPADEMKFIRAASRAVKEGGKFRGGKIDGLLNKQGVGE